MRIPYFRLSKWMSLALALALFLVANPLSYGQGHHPLRGVPQVAGPNFPAPFPILLANNGTLQASHNPQAGLNPNVTPFAYIASLPIGDRLPYNGIFSDPQLTPNTIYGQQFNQNLLQVQQQTLFGNPLGPVGTLLALGLINQPAAPGQNNVPPNFVGWGGRRPSPMGLPGLATGLGAGLYANPYMGGGMGYSPYMGQGFMSNPYMNQGMGMGMGFDPTMGMGQGMPFNPYLYGMMANPGFYLNPSQNNGANVTQPLFNQPPANPPKLDGFGKGKDDADDS